MFVGLLIWVLWGNVLPGVMRDEGNRGPSLD